MKKDVPALHFRSAATIFTSAIALAMSSHALASFISLPNGFNVSIQSSSADWSAAQAAANGNINWDWAETAGGGLVMNDAPTVGNGWILSDFTFSYTTNPSQTNAFSFTNTGATTDVFTITITTPGSLSGPTLMYGSITGGLTDNAPFTGATFAAPSGSSVYTALIDGSAISPTLWDDPYSTSTNPPALTASLGWTEFQAVPGPGVTSSISIVHHFTLTAGDSVTLNSAFQVIPGPGGLAVLVGGFLLGRRRRR